MNLSTAGLWIAAGIAVFASIHLNYAVVPAPALMNQAVAWMGWGLMLWMVGLQATGTSINLGKGLKALLVALLITAVGAPIATLQFGLPWSMALQWSATLAFAAAVAYMGASVASQGFQKHSVAQRVVQALYMTLVVSAVVSTGLCIVQIWLPELADGRWIAQSTIPGRAMANLRQPNHLATLMLWAAIALLWWFESEPVTLRSRTTLFLSLFVWLMLGIALTGSRTGMLGTVLIAVWALVDNRMAKPARLAALLAPVICVVIWVLLAQLPVSAEIASTRSERLSVSDSSSISRLVVWGQALELLKANPWLGVGVGGFNFAWTLSMLATPRPVSELFDHTHNLVVQLLVELGLPLGLLVIAALAYAVWQGVLLVRVSQDRATRLAKGSAMTMVGVMLLHSQLEYPLWFAHLLFPTAFLWGLTLSTAPASEVEGSGPQAILGAGVVAFLAGGLIAIDYARVVPIFNPPSVPVPIAQRIEQGQRSVLFGYHADYSLVTGVPNPGPLIAEFRKPVHFILDPRLMISWSTALAVNGDIERARWIAARLREINHPGSKRFFGPCDSTVGESSRPFQCDPPTARFTFHDFR